MVKSLCTYESIIYFRGARHGLTLSGKLSRIVAQEKQLLNENEINTENAQNIFQTWIQVKKKKHRVKKCTSSPNAIDASCITDSNHLDSFKRISKKKKKQQRLLDEDLAQSLSRLSTSNNSVLESDPFKFYGVQSSSKVIKKEEHFKKSHSEHSTRKAVKRNKKHRTLSAQQSDGAILDGHYATSEDSEKDLPIDPMVSQIKKIMGQYPNKKFKVEAKELTSFQKKQLQKSGLRIEFKSRKREKKRNKDFIQVDRIIKKINNSMDIHNSEIILNY